MKVYCHKCQVKVTPVKDDRCPKCKVVLWEVASRKHLKDSNPIPADGGRKET